MKTNNHPSWLVPLDIARKLKEIGMDNSEILVFSDDFHWGWCKSEQLYENDRYGEVYTALEVSQWENSNLEPTYTWEQVLEWFRNKGYHSTLHTYSVMQGDIEKFRFFYEINSNHDYIANPEEYYKTYEEAREALIREMINIYQIKK